jgi:hypothetical protein
MCRKGRIRSRVVGVGGIVKVKSENGKAGIKGQYVYLIYDISILSLPSNFKRCLKA